MKAKLFVTNSKDAATSYIDGVKKSLKTTSYSTHVIEPSPSIGIDEIRKLKAALTRKAFGGKKRLVVIKRIDKATLQAQNALLKLLEEPPEKTHFLLTANNLDKVIKTIASRAEIIRTSHQLSRKDKSETKKEDIGREIYLKIRKASPGKRIILAQNQAKSREEAKKTLECLKSYLHAQLHAKNNKDYSLKEIKSSLSKIISAFDFLERNVNYKLTLDILFLGLPKSS